MSEGRKAQIVLLDDTTLEILIQPKLFVTELLDLVASRFNLKEKEYFGLAFRDETNHYHWLQLDRKVLEHEFIKRTGPLVLHFSIRFFIESITYLRDSATIELFYCLAKQAVYREQIECGSDIIFELAALALQEAHGDYTEDESAKKQLMKLPVLPTGVLKVHPSITFCEDQVIEQYKKLIGRSRGDVIVQYMSLVEGLPTYGIHYYEVKDKSGIPWWLGLSYKGISLYDNNDKKMPRRVFAWSQLENLYYREKKFSIEVHDPKRVVHTLSSFNLYDDAIHEPLEDFDELSDAISDPTTQVSVSRRTFGPGNVNVHAWFAATPLLTKSIWSMAVSQHQFYLDRKQTRSQSQIGRSMSDIAADLSLSPSVFSTSSTPTPDVLPNISGSRCLSSTALLSTSSASVESDSEASKAAQRELYTVLKARKESLEDKLQNSLVKLKEICLQEAELTGELPNDYPLEPGESAPVVRKRIGTTFQLSPKIINCDAKDKNEFAQLEIEHELQSNITKAAYKLIQENNDKNIRKTRQLAYQNELQKLQTLEDKLLKCQKELNKRSNLEAMSSPTTHRLPDYMDISALPQHRGPNFLSKEFQKPFSSSDNCAKTSGIIEDGQRHMFMCAAGSLSMHPMQPKSAPSSPVRHFYSRQHPIAGLASPTPTRRQILAPSNSVRVASHCCHSHEGSSALHRVQRQLSNRVPMPAVSCRERDKNLYNLKTRQSDCYESGDELNVVPSSDCSSQKHWMLANDNLCSLHKTYREQVDGMNRCPHLCGDGQHLSHSKLLHNHGGYKVASPGCCFENEIYGSSQQHNNLYEYGAGYRSAGTTQPHFQGKSPSKDSAIHLGCSLTSLCSIAPVMHRCEPLQLLPHCQSQFLRYQTPPFVGSDDSYQSYEGVNLSQSEPSASSDPAATAPTTKNPAFREVSKPFEMSDFYKYSERLRRQRQLEEGPQSPLCSSSSGSLPHISRSAGAIQQQHDLSSGYSSSIAKSEQAASVDGLVHECVTKEPDYRYHMRYKDLLHPHIHPVSSDSCIVYPSQDDALSSPGVAGAAVPQHVSSSPYFTARAAAASDIYRQTDINRSATEPNEASFGSFRVDDGVAETFGEEMLAWFEKNEQLSQSPDGPSTLV